MKLIVNPHKIEIEKTPVNEREIDITKCEFEFAEEITNDYVKEAYFTFDGSTYKQIITNNECDIPSEVLDKAGQVEVGVVAYLVSGQEEIKRYNPSPAYFNTWQGSLKEAQNSQPITPSEMEQFEQALNSGLAEVANVDIDAEKIGSTATVSVTNRNGVTKTVEIHDGEKGESGTPGVDGVTPNIKVGNTETLPAGSEATVTQRGTIENPIFDFGIPKGADGSGGGAVTSVNGQTGDVVINIPDVSNFITKDVNNLANYYKKSETYTRTEVDNKVSSVYRYRGTVATYENLPSQDLVVGDVYNVESDGSNYAWTGIVWDKLGGDIDLSSYYTKNQTDSLLNSKQDTLTAGDNINIEEDQTTGELVISASGGSSGVVVTTSNYTSADIVAKVNEEYQKYRNGQPFNIQAKYSYSGVTIVAPMNFISGDIFYSSHLRLSGYQSGGGNNPYYGGFLYFNVTIENSVVTGIWRAPTWQNVPFGKGSGHILSSGNTSPYTPTSDYNPSTKKYVDDSISAIDLSGKQDTMQYSTMPTADDTTVGKIVQYTGATDSTYTNGYFYIGTTDGEETPTYSWENINVQNSGGGSSETKIEITTSNMTDKTVWQEWLDYYFEHGEPPITTFTYNNVMYPMLFGAQISVNNKCNVSFGNIDFANIGIYATIIVSLNIFFNNSTKNVTSVNTSYWEYGTQRQRTIPIVYGYNDYGYNYKVLATNNATAFTPTAGSYQPATAKYVDDKPTTYTGYDATKTQVLKNINGTLTWVDE